MVETLGRWGYQRAAEQLRPENLDAGLLMWFLRRRVRVDRLPADRVVTFLLPVGAPVTVDAPAPRNCRL